MPVPTASATNPATRMREIRFEIVIVKKSLDAANAMTAGKISRRAASMIKAVMVRSCIRSECLMASLLDVGQIVRHVRIGVLQVAANGVDDGDDRKRDAGDDDTVFDRGRARLVAQESIEHRFEAPRKPCRIRPHGDTTLGPPNGP